MGTEFVSLVKVQVTALFLDISGNKYKIVENYTRVKHVVQKNMVYRALI